MIQIVDLTDKKFPLGQILMTPGVQAKFGDNQGAMINYLHRHMTGDWGDLSDADKRSNEHALRQGNRLLSSYLLPDEHGGGKMYIITEWDRSVTTFLLPEEY